MPARTSAHRRSPPAKASQTPATTGRSSALGIERVRAVRASGRQEEEDEGDGGEGRPAAQERPAAVAGHGDAQEEQEQRPSRSPGTRCGGTGGRASRAHHERSRPGRSAVPGRSPRRLAGMRAASAGSWASALRTSTPRSGTERARRSALCGEEGGVGALRGAAEARPEGLRAHDRPRRAHEQGPVGHEVAPLGDRLVGDALGHEPGHPGVAEAQGRARPERSARRRSRGPRRGGSSPRRGGSPRRRAGRGPPSPRTVAGVLGSWPPSSVSDRMLDTAGPSAFAPLGKSPRRRLS